MFRVLSYHVQEWREWPLYPKSISLQHLGQSLFENTKDNVTHWCPPLPSIAYHDLWKHSKQVKVRWAEWSWSNMDGALVERRNLAQRKPHVNMNAEMGGCHLQEHSGGGGVSKHQQQFAESWRLYSPVRTLWSPYYHTSGLQSWLLTKFCSWKHLVCSFSCGHSPLNKPLEGRKP